MADTAKIDNNDVQALKDPPAAQPHSLTYEAYLVHLLHVDTLKSKAEILLAEMSQRQEKIKYLHDIQQAINNAMNADGSLDLSNNPGLKQQLKNAEEFGLQIPPGEKFDMAQTKRISENIHYKCDDLEKDNATQQRKVFNYFTESEQSIMLAKQTMTCEDKAKRACIAGVKG